jgi:hypothetical protein
VYPKNSSCCYDWTDRLRSASFIELLAVAVDFPPSVAFNAHAATVQVKFYRFRCWPHAPGSEDSGNVSRCARVCECVIEHSSSASRHESLPRQRVYRSPQNTQDRVGAIRSVPLYAPKSTDGSQLTYVSSSIPQQADVKHTLFGITSAFIYAPYSLCNSRTRLICNFRQVRHLRDDFFARLACLRRAVQIINF